jgi:hypothetical protein
MLKKIMKTTAITSFLMMSSLSLQALDVTTALSDDAVSIMNNVTESLSLEIDDKAKLKIFNGIFKVYADKGAWNMQPINNANFVETKKKINKESAQFVEYVFSYEERTVFISLINHHKQRLISTTIREVVPVSTTFVLEQYAKIQENGKQQEIYDTETYSLFSEKGFVSYTNYHVNKSNATVIYSYANTIEY